MTKNNDITIDNDNNNEKDKQKLLDINRIIKESSEGHMSLSDGNNQSYEGVKSTNLKPLPQTNNVINSTITVSLLSIDDSERINNI